MLAGNCISGNSVSGRDTLSLSSEDVWLAEVWFPAFPISRLTAFTPSFPISRSRSQETLPSNEVPSGVHIIENNLKRLVNEADKKALPWMMPRSEPITKNFGEIKVFAGLHAYLGMFDKGVTSASLCVEKEDEKKKEIAGVWVMGGEKGIETTASNVASSIPRLDGSVHRVKCRQYANMLILQDYVKNWGTLELSKNRLGTYLERLGVIRRLGFRKTGNSGPRGIFEPLQSESMIGVVPQAWTPELPCRGNGDRYELWNPEKIVEGLKGRRFKETSAIILAHLLAKRCLVNQDEKRS